MSWFIKTKDGERGPFPSSKLKEFIDAGKINERVMIRRDGQQQWVQAGSVAGLFLKSSPSASVEDKPAVFEDARSQDSSRSAVDPAQNSNLQLDDQNIQMQRQSEPFDGINSFLQGLPGDPLGGPSVGSGKPSRQRNWTILFGICVTAFLLILVVGFLNAPGGPSRKRLSREDKTPRGSALDQSVDFLKTPGGTSIIGTWLPIQGPDQAEGDVVPMSWEFTSNGTLFQRLIASMLGTDKTDADLDQFKMEFKYKWDYNPQAEGANSAKSNEFPGALIVYSETPDKPNDVYGARFLAPDRLLLKSTFGPLGSVYLKRPKQ